MSRLPELLEFKGQNQFRIIPSVYPPINFFEDLVDPKDMDILWDIEGLTNDRLRQEAGDISLVAPEDRVSGPGSSVVMAAFTHISLDRPTRFSNGSYGVYYAGLALETAILETVYHREQFCKATQEEPCEITMRVYKGKVLKPLHNIRNKDYAKLHNPHNYLDSQQFGSEMRELKCWGLVYNSVRHNEGSCIAVFRPPAITIPNQTTHLKYIWNGYEISEVLNINSLLKVNDCVTESSVD